MTANKATPEELAAAFDAWYCERNCLPTAEVLQKWLRKHENSVSYVDQKSAWFAAADLIESLVQKKWDTSVPSDMPFINLLEAEE